MRLFHLLVTSAVAFLMVGLPACGPADDEVVGEDELREAIEGLWVGVIYNDYVLFSVRFFPDGEVVVEKRSQGVSSTIPLRGTLGFGESDETIQRFQVYGDFTVTGNALDAGTLQFHVDTQESPPAPFKGRFVAELQGGEFAGETQDRDEVELFRIGRLPPINQNALVH